MADSTNTFREMIAKWATFPPNVWRGMVLPSWLNVFAAHCMSRQTTSSKDRAAIQQILAGMKSTCGASVAQSAGAMFELADQLQPKPWSAQHADHGEIIATVAEQRKLSPLLVYEFARIITTTDWPLRAQQARRSVHCLLILQEGLNEHGFPAVLNVERVQLPASLVSEQNPADDAFVPSASMAFVQCSPSFRQSMVNAGRVAREKNWLKPNEYAAWTLIRSGGNLPEGGLDGASMGAAFALSLAPLHPFDLEDVAITAQIDDQGRFERVLGLGHDNDAKLDHRVGITLMAAGQEMVHDRHLAPVKPHDNGSEVAGWYRHTLTGRHYVVAADISEACKRLERVGEYLRKLRKAFASIRLNDLYSRKAPTDRRFIDVKIDDIYITLQTQDMPQPAAGAVNPNDPNLHIAPTNRVSLEEALPHRNLVVEGEAGSGKSTFVHHVTYVLAGVQLGVPGIAESWTRQVASFPIMLAASHLASELKARKWQEQSLEPAIEVFAECLAHLHRFHRLTAGFFLARLQRGEATVLVDSLDEAAEADRPLIRQFIDALAKADTGCQFVLTSRPAALTPETEPDPKWFRKARIEPLDNDQIDRFLSRWCGALAFVYSDAEAAAELIALREIFRTRREIRRLRRNALLLTSIVVLHWSEPRLPGQRAALYSMMVQRLLKRNEANRYNLALTTLRKLYACLAWRMQCGDVHPGRGRRAETSEPRHLTEVDTLGVERCFAADYASPGVRCHTDPKPGEIHWNDFLSNQEVHSGILRPVGRSAISFWHRQFQELLAAEWLSHRTADERVTELISRADRLHHPDWREVVLLLAGLLTRADADEMVSQVLDQLGRKPTLEQTARTVGLLGAVVADLSAEGARFEPTDRRFRQQLDQVMGIFDAEKSKAVDIKVAVAAAEALGQAGDPRIEPSRREQNWIKIPACTFWMGAQKTDPKGPNYDLDADEDESPVHQVTLPAYRIGKYPVTVAEYQEFIEDGGYAQERRWSAGGFRMYPAPNRWEDQVGHPNRPVGGVSWYEAMAYASWAGARLPTETEWERAARGLDGRKYPWGQEKPKKRLLKFYGKSGPLTPIGVYPGGESQEGALDLAGNVGEWCGSEYRPYSASSETRDEVTTQPSSRVLRGRRWYFIERFCHSAIREGSAPGTRHELFGFRLVLDFSE